MVFNHWFQASSRARLYVPTIAYKSGEISVDIGRTCNRAGFYGKTRSAAWAFPAFADRLAAPHPLPARGEREPAPATVLERLSASRRAPPLSPACGERVGVRGIGI